MTTSDAEMPDHKALNEDLKEIAEHLARLRSDVERLASAIGATGSHQAEALQDQASEALSEGLAGIEESVRREPLKALAIAAGVGLLLGLVLGR